MWIFYPPNIAHLFSLRKTGQKGPSDNRCDIKISVFSLGNKVTGALNATVVSSLYPSLKEMLNIWVTDNKDVIFFLSPSSPAPEFYPQNPQRSGEPRLRTIYLKGSGLRESSRSIAIKMSQDLKNLGRKRGNQTFVNVHWVSAVDMQRGKIIGLI